jgi:cardiolipin synthase
VLTVPNLISLLRLALIPVFVWVLFGKDNPFAAGWLLGVIGSTDWIDGYLARRLDQVSEVGKFLDPLADRLAVVTAVVGGLITGDLPFWFAWALIVREGLIGTGAVIVAIKGHTKLDVRNMGKLATLLLYSAVAWFFVGSEWDWARVLGWVAGVPGLILYYIVGFQYAGDAIAAIRRSGTEKAPSN